MDVPADRWDIRTYYDPDPTRPGKIKTFHGGFLSQIDQFDAPFFGISPREAACLDPQQRLLLEVSWEAMEDAGIAPAQLAGSATGVFIGAFTLDYKVIQFSAGNRDLIDANTAAGSMMTMVSNRLSYTYDLRGPSLSVDTACSSSLVAVHLACQSLWRGECSLALAGGVNVIATPEYSIAESKGGFLAPDGRCKAFDARANGYARGEGAGVVVLKPLAQALADGDPVYALIRGTAANQDGRTNGITVPSGEAQQALLREACRQAGVAPHQIQYVEAHGTGTPVGDPIEANALGSVLSEGRPDDRPCVIGSIKTNLGHLEAAAGIAGLIKAALCLKQRAIPPHLNLEAPNPSIPFNALRLRLPLTCEPWPEHEGPALAGVNSFGFGGTNAHVILQESPPPQPVEQGADEQGADAVGRPYVLPLSAQSPEALQALAAAYRNAIMTSPAPVLSDLCFSAGLRRGQHDQRLALVGHSPEALVEQIDAFLAGEGHPGMAAGSAQGERRPRLAFVFSGMGPQWWAMGRQLIEREPVFRTVVERCDALLRQYASWSLLEELSADEAHSRMNETMFAQPANFALQLALSALWRSWGIVPDAVVGHSAGEVAAFYEAGTMSLEEAIRVIYHRSYFQQQMAGQGRMLAVGLSHEEVQGLLAGYEDRVSVAAVNSPSAVTLAGDPEGLDKVSELLEARGIFHRNLRVEVPYHSHYMDPIREPLLESLHGLTHSTATTTLYSTALGARVGGGDLDAGYWWYQVRKPVLFAASIDAMLEDGYTVFVELSPHPVLGGPMTECLLHRQRQGTVLPSLRRKEDEQMVMLGSLGALYTLGAPVDWAMLYPSGRHVRQPAYPWQRERHWNESEESAQIRLGYQEHPLLGRPLRTPTPTWELELSRRTLPYLDDHRIQGAVLYPGAGYAEMGLAAGRLAFGTARLAVEELTFHKALFLPDGTAPAVQVKLDPLTATFSVFSRAHGASGWTLHADGKLRQRQESTLAQIIELEAIRSRCGEELAGATCYAQFTAQGFDYGPHFQGITRLWRGAGEALAQLEAPAAVAAEGPAYRLHPALLDACFQVLIAVNPVAEDGQGGVYLPVGIDHLRIYGQSAASMFSHARLVERTAHLLRGDIMLTDEDGTLLAEIRGFRAQALERARGRVAGVAEQSFYEPVWQPQLREARPAEEPAEGPATWLLLSDTAVGPALAALLEARGDWAVLVQPGSSSQTLAPGRHYQVNLADAAPFAHLLAELRNAGLPVLRGAVHLWSLEDAGREELTLAELEAAQTRGSLAALQLVQALAQVESGPRLWLVTRGGQAVAAERDGLAVAQAPLWGLGRVIGYQELIGLWGGAIDLDPAAPADEAAALLDELVAPDGEDQVAFRAGERYSARLVRCEQLTPALPPHFRGDSSYLITGAFGALGLLVARWMIARGARRLVLVGRTQLPPRAEWGESDPQSPAAGRIAAIRELEALGASIAVAPIDVADEQELADFLARYRREGWPPIRGVIHSAGLVRDQILLQMDAATFNEVLRPKVLGGWALHRCLRDTPLDFFVLFSSVASLVVSTGQANYAAGNAFLDALAQHRRSLGLAALSVNWGPWAVGMVHELNLIEHYARRGMASITPEEGLAALGRLLGQRVGQAAVLGAHWPTVLDYYPRHPALFAHLAQQVAGALVEEAEQSFAELIARATPDERLGLVEARLRELAARVLRLDRAKLDPQQPLSAYGMNSMMAIELKNRVDLELQVSVAVVELLQGLGVSQLAARLLPQIEARLAAAHEDLAGEGPITEALAQRLVEQVGDAALTELLSELEGLTDEEAELLMRQQA